jgi:hypothetical protein
MGVANLFWLFLGGHVVERRDEEVNPLPAREDTGLLHQSDHKGLTSCEHAAKWLGMTLEAFYAVHLLVGWLVFLSATDENDCYNRFSRVMVLIVATDVLAFAGLLSRCWWQGTLETAVASPIRLALSAVTFVYFALVLGGAADLGSCSTSPVWQWIVSFPLAILASLCILALLATLEAFFLPHDSAGQQYPTQYV